MVSGFGAFGKIPILGDFLRLNLSPSFVQPWDDWLQAGITEVKERLGDQWNDIYLSAPIWRFTLPQGIAGSQAVSGILMASVDRVGRQYPLTLATPHASQNTALMHFANTATFERLEDVALRALDDDTTRDMLTSALSQIHIIEHNSSSDVSLPYVGVLPPAQVLAATAITQIHGASTALWSTAMEGDHRLMSCPGLPQARDLQALFDISSATWNISETAFHS